MYFISLGGGSSSKENGQCESPKRKRDMLLQTGGTDRPRWLQQREKVKRCMDAGRGLRRPQASLCWREGTSRAMRSHEGFDTATEWSTSICMLERPDPMKLLERSQQVVGMKALHKPYACQHEMENQGRKRKSRVSPRRYRAGSGSSHWIFARTVLRGLLPCPLRRGGLRNSEQWLA